MTALKSLLLMVVFCFMVSLLGCAKANQTNRIFTEAETTVLIAATSNVLASANFTSPPGDHNIAGRYEVVRLTADDTVKLNFLSDFIVEPGPDLHILLSVETSANAVNSN